MTTKVQRLDFNALTLCEALDLAILIEEEAMERYLELADQLEKHRTPDAARFFRFMAGNEAKHCAALVERRLLLPGEGVQVVDRGKIFDVEAPEYDEARAFMSVRQALYVALAAESKAHDFFVWVLPRVSDPDVSRLFSELRDEELAHQVLVERELAKLSPEGTAANPDDYGDEPVGQ